MPRLMVIVAGLLIVSAAAYGGVKGYQFTDLDKAPPPPATPVDVAVKPAAAAQPPAPVLDEQAVRELARLEVKDVIPPMRRRAPVAEAAIELPTFAPEAAAPAPPEAPPPESAPG